MTVRLEPTTHQHIVAQMRRAARRRLPWTQRIARWLSILFALVGMLPVVLLVLARTDRAQRWAASKAQELLLQQLGLHASFSSSLETFPLGIVVSNLEVPSNGSTPGPALRVARLSVQPSIFSILQGELVVQELNIEGLRANLRLRDGKLTNIDMHLPRAQSDGEMDRPPFRSISLDDARVDLTVDGQRVIVEGLDADLSVQKDGALEILSRADRIQSITSLKTKDGTRIYRDLACGLDVQGRFEKDHLLLRRFSLSGLVQGPGEAAQSHPASCHVPKDDPRRVRVKLHMLSARLSKAKPVAVSGDVELSGPAWLAGRWVSLPPVRGRIEVKAHGRWVRGDPLPVIRAQVAGSGLQLGVFRLASTLRVDAKVNSEGVYVNSAEIGFADGKVRLSNATFAVLDPAVPLSVEHVQLTGLEFPALMRDLGVTEHAHVKMTLPQGSLRHVRGTLSPLHIDSRLTCELQGFEVFDEAVDNPARQHVIGVSQATVHGGFAVRPHAVQFQDSIVRFGQSSLRVFASLGFHNEFGLRIGEGSRLDLSDISPLLELPWKGKGQLSVRITGTFNDPTIRGKMSIRDFSFARMDFGDIESGTAEFRPMLLKLNNVRARRGRSSYTVPWMILDFEGPSPVVATARVESDSFHLHDFLRIFHMHEDPRYQDVHATMGMTALLRYEQGGPSDMCHSGRLHVSAQATAPSFEVSGERFHDGRLNMDLDWFDMNADQLGMRVRVPAFFARKGKGTIAGSGSLMPGGVLQGSAVASEIPISAVQSLGIVGQGLKGAFGASVEVSGTLDQPRMSMDVDVGPTWLGSSRLGKSKLHVRLLPFDGPPKPIGRTSCGLPIPAPFDRTAYEKDRPRGVFEITGQLFHGQLRFEPLRVTWQRQEVVSGRLMADDWQLGPLLSGFDPEGSFGGRIKGNMKAVVDIRAFSRWHPERSDLSVHIDRLEITNRRGVLRFATSKRPLTFRSDRIELPSGVVRWHSPGAPELQLAVGGNVTHVSGSPHLDLHARLEPLDLSALQSSVPGVDRLAGKLDGSLELTGSLFAPSMSGRIDWKHGMVALRAVPVPIHDVRLSLGFDGGTIRVRHASASWGGGTLRLSGSMPMRGFEPGPLSVRLVANHVRLPLRRGIETTFDADLRGNWNPSAVGRGAVSSHVSGTIDLRSLVYSRPFALDSQLGALAEGRARKKVEAHDPDGDFFRMHVVLRASHPIVIRNNLADMKLEVASGGLTLEGSNQQFGAVGALRVLPGSKLHLRNNEFEIKEGWIRFDDPTHLDPYIDLTAVTEYRRYAQARMQGAQAGGGQGQARGTSDHLGGLWRIQMHTYGTADQLRLDLSSEPSLSQEDIVLLLTMGVTRAELDSMQASALGESAALEALSALTGAGSAVREVVPVIDEFRFGTAYSARSGKSEPTITVGKRITNRLHANVTTGLSDNQEVRSNIEWKFTNKTSILGSYDNVNNVSNSSFGNLGADIRFRLVFE